VTALPPLMIQVGRGPWLLAPSSSRGSLSSHFRAESGMGLLGINRLMPDRGILAKLCGDTVR
jgi:hypothetical protein